MYSRHQIGSESMEEFEEKSSNRQTKLFVQRNRLVPRGAVESLTISDWSVGGSNPSTCVSFFFFFFVLSLCPLRKFFFLLIARTPADKSEEQLSIEFLVE